LKFDESKKENDMQEPAAKLLFDTGAFSKAIVVPVPMGEGYHLHLVKIWPERW